MHHYTVMCACTHSPYMCATRSLFFSLWSTGAVLGDAFGRGSLRSENFMQCPLPHTCCEHCSALDCKNSSRELTPPPPALPPPFAHQHVALVMVAKPPEAGGVGLYPLAVWVCFQFGQLSQHVLRDKLPYSGT